MSSVIPKSKDLVRCDGWPAALNAELEFWRGQFFVWGAYDCLGFCRSAAEAVVGVDPLGGLPSYRSERQALRELRSLGFDSAIDLVGSFLVEVSPALARRGDWVLMPTVSLLGCAFGVNMGRHSAHMDVDGLVFADAANAVRAWRVGL